MSRVWGSLATIFVVFSPSHSFLFNEKLALSFFTLNGSWIYITERKNYIKLQPNFLLLHKIPTIKSNYKHSFWTLSLSKLQIHILPTFFLHLILLNECLKSNNLNQVVFKFWVHKRGCKERQPLRHKIVILKLLTKILHRILPLSAFVLQNLSPLKSAAPCSP